MLAEVGNKAFWHNFNVLNSKMLVTKLDLACQHLIRIKQSGGQIAGFAERA